MRNDIQPDLQTIEEYFQRNEFYIPSYQRPYAWQVSHCEQLIEDIETHKDNFDKNSQDNYFFGAVLIAQESGEEHEVTLIDGQQRTTTFMLLLKALLLKLKGEIKNLSKESFEDQKLYDRLSGLRDKIISMLYTLDEDEHYSYKTNNYLLQPNNIKYLNESISELYSEDMKTILIGEKFDNIKDSVIKISKRQKDNKYTNYYKNFRYFNEYCKELTNTQIRDFSDHFIKYCQIITITSFDTDQAINIFNSLNGTGVPLTPIEVIVSKTTAFSANRKNFESNWQEIVSKTDNSCLDLNSLITHYIFIKLSKKNSAERRNPGIRNFFNNNKNLLKNDTIFTNDLNTILDNINVFYNDSFGNILDKFNGNLKPFLSSYLFFRDDNSYLEYLLKFGALIELTEYSYSHGVFKGFLEDINLKYSQIDTVTTKELIVEAKNHIRKNFDKSDIRQTLNESGVSKPLIYLNEYLYNLEKNDEILVLGETVDIEHIMPQSGKNRENIMKDAGFKDSGEFYEYAEKIGNKILLESEINRGIGDAWFRTKKENYISSHCGYKGSRYPIALSLVEYPKDTWTKEDIDSVTAKAAERIINFIFE